MPPYAICDSPKCRYIFDMKDDDDNVAPQYPPFDCPTCGSKVIYCCPVCYCPILVLPQWERPSCGSCSGRLRGGCRSPRVSAGDGEASVAESRSPKQENNTDRSPDVVLRAPPVPCARMLDLNRPSPTSTAGQNVNTTSKRKHRAV